MEQKSSYETYYSCRSRDMCLRYMGENPAKFADSTVCPCPCTKEFYEEMMMFHRVKHEREIFGDLPYSVSQEVKWRLQDKKRIKALRIKQRNLPITQQRLPICDAL